MKAIEGIATVEAKGNGGYEVESVLGADLRTEIAAAIVEGGW